MNNPFKMLGDLNAMRKQAAEIQKALEQERFEVTVGDTRVVMSGNQNVLEFEVDGVSNDDARRAINDCIKKSQQAAAGKLAQLTQGMQ